MPTGSRSSLDRLILAGVALAVALTAAVIGVAWRSAERYRTEVEWISRDLTVATTIQALLSDVQDIETGARGFALTGDDAYLAPYRRGRAEVDDRLAQLRGLMAGDPAEAARLGRLGALVAQRREAAAALIAARQHGGAEESMALVRAAAGRTLMDAIRDLVAQIQRAQRAALSARRQQAAVAAGQAWLALAGLSALVAIFLGALVYLLRRQTRLREEMLAELERLVAERSAALEDANARLRRGEVMAALGAIVGGVAHEARNPLFSISATVDALEARIGTRDDTARHFELLRHQLGRLTALMQELFDYGRPQTAALVPGALADAVAEAAQACRQLADQEGVDVEVRQAGGLPPVAMDRDRIVRLVANLLTNGIQMAGRGGRVEVEVTASGEDPAAPAWIECRVSDSGPGFDAEDLPHVFAPFFSRRRGGTGLGLAIVQRCAEQHGGVVEAANRPAGGAVVTVRLPAAGRCLPGAVVN